MADKKKRCCEHTQIELWYASFINVCPGSTLLSIQNVMAELADQLAEHGAWFERIDSGCEYRGCLNVLLVSNKHGSLQRMVDATRLVIQTLHHQSMSVRDGRIDRGLARESETLVRYKAGKLCFVKEAHFLGFENDLSIPVEVLP